MFLRLVGVQVTRLRPAAIGPVATGHRSNSAIKGCPVVSPSRSHRDRTFDSAVHRRPGDTEQFTQFRSRVLSHLVQVNQVRFLLRVQFGLLTLQPAFGLGDLHAFMMRWSGWLLGGQASRVFVWR